MFLIFSCFSSDIPRPPCLKGAVAATRYVLNKKVLLKISQNSQETPVPESHFKYSYSLKNFQKQPPRGVPRKRRSENMQQIYRRTSMPKCEFNKVALKLY